MEATLIVPTYNEAQNLPLLCEEIFSALDGDSIDLELIVVDDNSPDGTAVVARELSAKYPLRLISRPGKLGLGSAVAKGIKESTREYVGVIDADLSHDPILLNKLVLALKECDIAIGSRFLEESRVDGWNAIRRPISYFGVLLAKILVPVKDPLSGYFFMRRKVVDNLELSTKGYKILLEILVKGTYEKISEFPYHFRIRKYSASKLDFREFIMYLLQIVQLLNYKYFNKYHGRR